MAHGTATHQGLIDDGIAAVRVRISQCWDAALTAATEADLDAKSRLRGWSGRDIVAPLGTWQNHDPLQTMVDSARSGTVGTVPIQKVIDEAARDRYADRPRDELLAGLTRARDTTLGWLDSPEADLLGRSPAATLIGPLPLLTGISCVGFQLATSIMDLEACGAAPADRGLLLEALGTICDATAAVAFRQCSYATITVQTPDGGWVMDIRRSGWTTVREGAGPVRGTGVAGEVRDLLDLAAGRASIPRFLATGRLKVMDLTGFLELAPLIDQMPGIPNRSALSAAASRLRVINQYLHRRTP